MFVLEDNDCICPKIGLKPTSQKKEGYRPGTRRFRLICSLPTAGTTLLNTTSPLYLTRKSPWTDTREASLPSEQSRSEGPRPLAAGPASSRDRRHLPRPRGDGGPHACNPPRTQMPPPLPKAQRRDGDTQASGPQPCQLHGCLRHSSRPLRPDKVTASPRSPRRTPAPLCRDHPWLELGPGETVLLVPKEGAGRRRDGHIRASLRKHRAF